MFNKSSLLRTTRSPDVTGIVLSVADAICAEANEMLSPGGYVYQEFEVKPMKNAGGFVVRTKTDHARYSQRKNNTLGRAMSAARRQ